MARRNIFRVQSPLGYAVVLSRDRWRQIVRRKHPALANHEADVRACLLSPMLIRLSIKEPAMHLHYVPASGPYLCVVTAPSNEKSHFVVTAYFTRNIKKGTELWKK